MHNALLSVLSLSLSGTAVAGILLLCMRLVRGRLQSIWMYYIWLIVVARLLIPFSPQVNLVGSLLQPRQAVTSQGEQPGTQRLGPDTVLAAQPGAEAHTEGGIVASPQGEASNFANGNDWMARMSAVWLAGALLLFLRGVVMHRNLIRQVRRESKACESGEAEEALRAACQSLHIARPPRILVNNMLPSPMLVGFFRQDIVLPKTALQGRELGYILRHELIHYKRLDVLYKWSMQLAVCVHWFNPVVYLVSRQVNRYCELACDAAVISGAGASERLRYGEAILSAVKPRAAIAPTGVSLSMSEDIHMLKERLDGIVNYRTASRATGFVSALLASTLLCGAAFAGSYPAPARMRADGPVAAASANTVAIKGETWLLVDTEEQLRSIGSDRYPLSGKYLLNADIALDKAVDWVPIGTRDNPFTGVFNGNGHEIIDLTITDPTVNPIGMFAYARAAQIYNVTLRNVDIQGAFRPGDTIAPVLAIGGGSDSFDNWIIDPVEVRESGNLTVAAKQGKDDDAALSDRLGEFAPYGLAYDARGDRLTYNGQRVKLFVVYKEERAFDICWQDRDSGGLYLEGVTGTGGRASGVVPLEQTEADRLLEELQAADVQSTVPRVVVPAHYSTFDATFTYGADEVVATDHNISKTNVPADVRRWIASCDAAVGAYRMKRATAEGYTYYFYYNGGGRYPWLLDVGDAAMHLTLQANDSKATTDGYHIMRIDTLADYTLTASLGDKQLQIWEE